MTVSPPIHGSPTHTAHSEATPTPAVAPTNCPPASSSAGTLHFTTNYSTTTFTLPWQPMHITIHTLPPTPLTTIYTHTPTNPRTPSPNISAFTSSHAALHYPPTGSCKTTPKPAPHSPSGSPSCQHPLQTQGTGPTTCRPAANQAPITLLSPTRAPSPAWALAYQVANTERHYCTSHCF